MVEKTASELKREREQAARKAMFVSGADERPANTDLSALLGPEDIDAPPVDAAVDLAPSVENAPEAAEAPGEAQDVDLPAPVAAKPVTARKSAPKPPPWADAIATGLTLPIAAELNGKILWIMENVAGKWTKSKQKLATHAITEFVDKIIAEHYKP